MKGRCKGLWPKKSLQGPLKGSLKGPFVPRAFEKVLSKAVAKDLSFFFSSPFESPFQRSLQGPLGLKPFKDLWPKVPKGLARPFDLKVLARTFIKSFQGPFETL